MFTAAIGSETKETTAAKDLIEYLKGPAAVLQQTAGAEIPIASDARTLHTSRGFLPRRFAYAGPAVRRSTFMGPASANLHISGHSSFGHRPYDCCVAG